ncbi:MAG: 50S ribosomal protein L24 [Pseudomonadota bacterium]
MKKLQVGDEVQVIAGKSKGSRGRILKIIDGKRCLVSGANLVKKHQKPNPQKQISAEIITKESAVDISNVMLWNADSGKPGRVGIRIEEDGKKVRFFKGSDALVPEPKR